MPPPIFQAPANMSFDFAYPGPSLDSCAATWRPDMCGGSYGLASTVSGGNVGNLIWSSAYNNIAVTTNKMAWAYQYPAWGFGNTKLELWSQDHVTCCPSPWQTVMVLGALAGQSANTNYNTLATYTTNICA